jgi:type II restriction/modification system DNA methylase subunit YeeA
MEVSIKAGEIVGQIYDKLLEQYKTAKNLDMEKCFKSLNMLCVRLVFCLYAEDAGIFGHKSMFGDYLNHFEAKDLRNALLNLFKVLDQKIEDRDPFLEKELAAFPYVNGGLFTEEDQFIPPFTEEIKDLLIKKASDDFDWSEISPTIFGAVFESTLNPETRRKGGMHYTSIENIHKVIDPLFMDELNEEFETIKELKQEKTKETKLIDFQEKLGKLKFLDPACGSGNFLTETYLSIRRLENEVISILNKGEKVLGFDDFIKVKINQFYGIEINDFAVVVAKTALWIAESQMMKETEAILLADLEF